MLVACIFDQVGTKRPSPLTTVELQEMARTCTMQRERLLLWEVSRLRRFVRRVDELEVLIRDERRPFMNDPKLQKLANAIRADLDHEPVILEERERHEAYLNDQRMRGRYPLK